ncbi:MAG: 50S ribosomal protein L15 [Planctomycetes bacterium]|nr:50S ribosomal protein L15 [Planctomycetota bacterium]
MNLTQVHSIHTGRRKDKRVGRGLGSGKGKTCGRGGKGQSARSGWHAKYYFEGGQMPLVRKLPKRGFSNFNFRKVYATLNLRDLDGHDLAKPFDTARFLAEGLINSIQDGVKILGEGELKGPVTIKAHRFSASAMEKITKAGGKFEWLDAQPKPEKKFKKPVAPKGEKPKKVSLKAEKKEKVAKVEGAPQAGKPAGGPQHKKPEGGKPQGGKKE